MCTEGECAVIKNGMIKILKCTHAYMYTLA